MNKPPENYQPGDESALERLRTDFASREGEIESTLERLSTDNVNRNEHFAQTVPNGVS